MSAARFLLAIYLLLALASPGGAAPPESEVRAAIVVNFVHYVDWPDAVPGSETLICVTGRGPTVDALLANNGRISYGRGIAVASRSQPASTAGCRILFIGESSLRSPADWLRDAAAQPILTVSESDDFLPNGGIINLARSDSRVVFDVSLPAMRRANLRIRSQLLRLAREVHGK